MLKTVKNGSGIRVDPPPVFSKFPHFPVFFLGTSLSHMIRMWEIDGNVRSRPALPLVPEPFEGSGGERIEREEEEEVWIFV